MDYDGLIINYKWRGQQTLTQDERDHQLKQDLALDLNSQRIADDLSVVRLTSGYMELVDKYYQFKGILTSVMLSMFMLSSWVVFKFWGGIINDIAIHGFNNDVFYYISGFIFGGIFFIFLLLSLCLLKKESFARTHYPIRFDRKNQLVHVFSLEGEIYSVKWSDIFFTTGDFSARKHTKRKDYDIRGHILDKDGKTVLKTFGLAASASNHVALHRYWEFIRRYMEEGPEAVANIIKICPPVEKKREGIFFGYWYALTVYYGAPLVVMPIMMVLALIAWPGRVFAMYTSRRPFWTSEVEAACVIDPNDPFDMSATDNPKSIALWMLGMDKSHRCIDKMRVRKMKTLERKN